MNVDFYKFLSENGTEAFDKLLDEVAAEATKARKQYDEDQEKKKKEALNKAEAAEKRKAVANQIGKLLKDYYGDKLPLDTDTMGVKVLEAVDDTIAVSASLKQLKDSASTPSLEELLDLFRAFAD